MPLTFMTLNLWGYADWDARNEGVIELANKVSADILALQEVQTNLSFSNIPQSTFIADHANYPYSVFAPSLKKVAQRDIHGERSQTAGHGLAILSKHPIISTESYFLEPQPSHPEPCTVLFCTIKIDNQLIDVCNVHFGNNDVVSDLQIKELIALCEARNIHPIILGDFNNFDVSRYRNTILKDYVISIDVKPYTSMPRNDGTLDYILAPNGFKIDSVTCSEEYVSDHRAVIAVLTETL